MTVAIYLKIVHSSIPTDQQPSTSPISQEIQIFLRASNNIERRHVAGITGAAAQDIGISGSLLVASLA
eukprot:scaffold125381_cov45-Prasinocladus_malaysianus.AAC.1